METGIGYPPVIADAVEQLSSLPGVGRKTALRLVLHLLRQPKEKIENFGRAFVSLKENVRYCEVCGMISDSDRCAICSDTGRDRSTVCVVESARDVISIEETGEYNGVYHVLGGLISPMDGIGPDDLNISSLADRISRDDIREVILALSTGMDGETTSFFISKTISATGVKMSRIARGIGFGDDLEYTDRYTLGRAITDRVPI